MKGKGTEDQRKLIENERSSTKQSGVQHSLLQRSSKGTMPKPKKNVLGRGLGALLTDAMSEDTPQPSNFENVNRIFEIDIDKINTGIYQPRQYFDDNKLQELKNSIKENGIIQPLIVVKSEMSAGLSFAERESSRRRQSRFDLIAGERRYRAAKSLGLKTVPAIIKDLSGAPALEIALIENIQRQDLNIIEEAGCYLRLIEEFNLTHEELSKKVGKDRATITNILRILSLPDHIKKELMSGKITPSHARNLIGLSGEEASVLFNKITNEKLTVRDTENAAKILKLKTKKGARKGREAKKDYATASQIKSYENDLFEELQTRVRINYKNKENEIKGRIEIDFYSTDDLERIIDILKK